MSETRVKTGKVRFSYANVFKPKAISEDAEEKYSVSLIIPKSDKKTVAKIQAAIDAALEAGVTKLGGKVPKNFKNPLRDGDTEREDDDNYKGSYFVNANSTRKPGIVDADLEPIMDQDEFYSGCYGRATLNFYAFNVNGNKGVACGLQNLQKLEDGDRLGGSAVSAEDDFAKDEDDLM
jgi:hypothetical protein